MSKESKPIKGIKKFLKEFGAFINKGNVMNLAVAVIIGGAFTAIVTSLTNDIIMPLITAVFALCGVKGGLAGMSVVLNGVPKYVTVDGIETLNPEAVLWNYGNFIQSIIDFILIALVVFCLIKAITFAIKKGEQAKEALLEHLEHQHQDEAKEEAKEEPKEEPSPEPAPEATAPVVSDEVVELLKEIKELLKKNNSCEEESK